MAKKRSPLFCSFCRKGEAEVPSLIAGPGVLICGDCVGICTDILKGRPTAGFPGWDSLSDEALLRSLRPSIATTEAVRGVLQTQVDVLRRRKVSWEAIGQALGVSRQAAWERFG